MPAPVRRRSPPRLSRGRNPDASREPRGHLGIHASSNAWPAKTNSSPAEVPRNIEAIGFRVRRRKRPSAIHTALTANCALLTRTARRTHRAQCSYVNGPSKNPAPVTGLPRCSRNMFVTPHAMRDARRRFYLLEFARRPRMPCRRPRKWRRPRKKRSKILSQYNVVSDPLLNAWVNEVAETGLEPSRAARSSLQHQDPRRVGHQFVHDRRRLHLRERRPARLRPIRRRARGRDRSRERATTNAATRSRLPAKAQALEPAASASRRSSRRSSIASDNSPKRASSPSNRAPTNSRPISTGSC